MGGTLHRLAPLLVPAAMRLDERLALMPALDSRTESLARALVRALAHALASVAGLRASPAEPQVNMLHLHFDGTPAALIGARDQRAPEQGIWLFGGMDRAMTPGWGVAEMHVRDRLLQIDDAFVVASFVRLLEVARGCPGLLLTERQVAQAA